MPSVARQGPPLYEGQKEPKGCRPTPQGKAAG